MSKERSYGQQNSASVCGICCALALPPVKWNVNRLSRPARVRPAQHNKHIKEA